MKASFVLNIGLYSKTGKGILSQNAPKVQIQDIFENDKPGQGFYHKKNSFYNFSK